MLTRTTDNGKGFGCRRAYESLSCRNPRATVDVYGDFDLQLMSAMARPPSGSSGVNADSRFVAPPRGIVGTVGGWARLCRSR